jgi:alkanesulfonate monooxygenase SsuD/methylene tetrahydromethanopterin reductase-like flavin-dependent oxidoreductase (luciferase family)
VLELAWSGEDFDYGGEVYQVSGGRLRPTPVRPGRPPLWIGAATPRARARVVRRRAGLLLSPLIEFEAAARQFDAFDAEADRQGVGPLSHGLWREIVVGDSAEHARARVQPYLDYIYRVQYAPERTGLTRYDPDSGRRVPLSADDPYYLSPEFLGERWCFGSPEQCAEIIAGWLRRSRIDRLQFQPKMPGRSIGEAVTDLKRLLHEVVPLLKQKLAGASGGPVDGAQDRR